MRGLCGNGRFQRIKTGENRFTNLHEIDGLDIVLMGNVAAPFTKRDIDIQCNDKIGAH
jgi:hypothetical protein